MVGTSGRCLYQSRGVSAIGLRCYLTTFFAFGLVIPGDLFLHFKINPKVTKMLGHIYTTRQHLTIKVLKMTQDNLFLNLQHPNMSTSLMF